MNPRARRLVSFLLWLLNLHIVQSLILTGIIIKGAIQAELLDSAMWGVYQNSIPVFLIFLGLTICIRFMTTSSSTLFTVPLAPTGSYPKLGRTDLERFAIHEAGHIVGLGLFKKMPDKIVGKINKKPDGPRSGFISFSAELITREDMVACLKVLLAASCAENIILKESFVGSEIDNTQFEHIARKYLNLFAGSDKNVNYPWFREPLTEFEAKVNAQSICELMNDLYVETTSFLRKNEALIHQVADDLKRNPRNEIRTARIREILRNVVC